MAPGLHGLASWVAVGGRKDLTAALIGALVLEWVGIRLAAVGEISLLIMGAILVIAMLATPEGVITTLARGVERGKAFARTRWGGMGVRSRSERQDP